MDPSLQPPFIADVICYLLIIALFYLVYYSYNLRKEILNQRIEKLIPQSAPVVNKKLQQPPTNSQGKIQIYIEPSPVPGQKVPFPSVFTQPEVELSVIIPVYNMQDTIINVLDKIRIYFSEKQAKFNNNNNFDSNDNFTYEVIVIDMLSTDNTHSVIYDYALQYTEFRILKIPIDLSLNFAVLIGATRIRGKLLFIYLPDEDLPLRIYSQLENKIETARNEYNNKEIIVLSCLANPDQQIKGNYDITDNEDNNENQSFADEHYVTLLSSFIDYLLKKILLLSTNIDPKACSHFRTMLITREAAQVIFPNIKLNGDWFDQELLVIAAKQKMIIKCTTVEPGKYYGTLADISSWERIYRLLDLSQNLLLYSTGIWKILRRKA